MDKPKIVYGDYLLNLLDARQKAAVLHQPLIPELTAEQLARPVTVRLLVEVLNGLGKSHAELARRVAALEQK